MATRIIVWGEVYEGLLDGGRSEERVAQPEAFTATLDLISPDTRVARQYAQLRAKLRAQGRILADNDPWIAATALAHDLTLVSRDNHFRWILG